MIRAAAWPAVLGLAAVAAAQDPPPPGPAPPGPVAQTDERAKPRWRVAHRVHEGLVYSVEEIRRKHLRYKLGNVAGEDGKAKEVPAEVERVSRESWTDTVRGAANGAPTKLERHYHARTAYERHHTTTQDVQVRRPLHGRTLELRREGGVVRAKSLTGEDLKAEDSAELRLLPGIVAFLPEQPVAVGDRWRLNARAVNRLLGDAAAGGTTTVSAAFGSLEAVTDQDVGNGVRHRVATLQVEFALATRLRPDLMLVSKLRGTIAVDLTAESLLRAQLTGTLTATSDAKTIAAGAVSVEVNGEVDIRVVVVPGRVDPGRVAPRGSGR